MGGRGAAEQRKYDFTAAFCETRATKDVALSLNVRKVPGSGRGDEGSHRERGGSAHGARSPRSDSAALIVCLSVGRQVR